MGEYLFAGPSVKTLRAKGSARVASTLVLEVVAGRGGFSLAVTGGKSISRNVS